MCARSKVSRVVATLSSLGLVACAHYQAAPLDKEQIAVAQAARDLGREDLRYCLRAHSADLAEPWPRQSWDFEGLTLAAFCLHPELAVARAEWDVARAGVDVASARQNPSITLTPGYNLDATGTTSPWLPSIGIEIPIETGSKRGNRTTRAQHLAQSAQLNLISTAWRIRSTLRAALIELKSQVGRVRLIEQQVAAQQRIVSLLTQRVSLGASPSGELSAANIALTRTQIALVEGQQQEAEARSDLAEALGVPLHAVMSLPVDDQFIAASPLETKQAQPLALQHRADIAAGLVDYAVAEADLRSEFAKQYPDVRLGPAFEWDQGERKWTLGVSFELPLNRNRPAIHEALARREESAARFRALEIGVIAEVERSVSSYQSSRAEYERLKKLDVDLDSKVSLERARLAAGDIDQVQFQRAALERLEAALALLDSRATVARAAGALEGSVQQPIAALEILHAQSNAESTQ